MADDKKPSGWFKALVGAIAGVVSGGVFMYVSPLVDKVIKPQKPLANFAVETNGLQITLHNRSIGGDGFWDFGDGSALEPARPDAETVTHTYAKAGQYSVKLAIRNYLGDENERVVPVDLRGAGNGAPAILSLEAVPVCPHPIAPATFRVTCQAQNVETCVWDFGADKPLEVTSDSPNQQEKLVTFATPGKYFVQLAVLNGKQSERKWVPVVVEPAPANSLMAVLSVVDQGMRTDSFQETVNVTLGADAGTRPFERHLPAPHGYVVAEARLAGLPPVGVRNIAVLLRADHKSVNVTGETQPNAKPSQTGGPPMIVIPVALRYEKQVVENRPVARSTVPLSVPGVTTLPLACCPRNWISTNRAMVLELFDGSEHMAKVTMPCSDTPIAWQGRRYILKADISREQATITLKDE
jgi:PKD repeat protein